MVIFFINKLYIYKIMIKKFDEFNKVNESVADISNTVNIIMLSLFGVIQIFKYKYADNLIRLNSYLIDAIEKEKEKNRKIKKEEGYCKTILFLFSELSGYTTEVESQNFITKTLYKGIEKINDKIGGKGYSLAQNVVETCGYNKFIEVVNLILSSDKIVFSEDFTISKTQLTHWLNTDEGKKTLLKYIENSGKNNDNTFFEDIKKVWNGEM